MSSDDEWCIPVSIRKGYIVQVITSVTTTTYLRYVCPMIIPTITTEKVTLDTQIIINNNYFFLMIGTTCRVIAIIEECKKVFSIIISISPT